MSSLTTTSNSTEDCSGTWLSLGIGAPTWAPAPVRHGELFPPSQELREVPGEGTDAPATRSRRSRRIICGGDGGCPNPSDGGKAVGGGGVRKKLRLTGEQAALLEGSFRLHNIFSHDEKHDLARELGLKPRQVEVWFQNRRARTKLKQTELDCEVLRRWCERLSDDNARLRRDLTDARSSLTDRDTDTGIAACPSCSKLALIVTGGQNSSFIRPD